MNTLAEKITAEIEAAGGAISLARFMDLALYTPELGYYDRQEHSPGKRGDFFTSVSVGHLFGGLLAHRFAYWLAKLPGDGPLHLVEAGAHDGQLAADVIATFNQNYPRLTGRLVYWIVEPSSRRRKWQRQTLHALSDPDPSPMSGSGSNGVALRWANELSELPEKLTGIVFSNELLDAFPIHRIGWDAAGQQWFEWQVGRRCGRFAWQRGSLPETLEPPDLPQALLEVLPDGFATEFCPAAADWWKRTAQRISRGWLMTIDYGLPAGDFFVPHRNQGTLRGYYRHQLVPDVLERPGEIDLTAHVNFSALQRAGENAGMSNTTLTSQGNFLLETMANLGPDWTIPSNLIQQILTLTHPEHLGNRFQVIVQQKIN